MTENNNIWHSKEEKPEVNSRVLYINYLGAKHLCTFGRTNFIEEGRDINKAEKWCYLSDLLSLEQQLQAKEEEIERLNHNLKVKQEFLDNQYNNYIKIVEEKDKRINALEAELRGYRLDETFSIGALKKKKKKLEKH